MPIKISCPPEPETIRPAAAAVMRTQEAADATSDALHRATPASARYHQLANEYAAQVAAALESEERLRETMRGYGRDLRRDGVKPEHIIICVRQVLDDARLRQYGEDRRLANRALGWAIEGYYADTSPS